MSMFSSPWRVYLTFTLGASDVDHFSVEQRLTRFVPNPQPRQALTLPVRPLDAVAEALPLLHPIYAHYVAQWPKVLPRSDEEKEFGRGFFLEGSVVPEQIADPSRADELDEIYLRNIPEEIRRTWSDEGGWAPHALRIDPELIASVGAYCVPAAELGIEPFPQ
jgi:hypothetical protein